jgi:hypothetical protein
MRFTSLVTGISVLSFNYYQGFESKQLFILPISLSIAKGIYITNDLSFEQFKRYQLSSLDFFFLGIDLGKNDETQYNGKYQYVVNHKIAHQSFYTAEFNLTDF